MTETPREPVPPHQDPSTWGGLVESLDVASVFVALNGWIGPKLRGQVSVEDIWQETL